MTGPVDVLHSVGEVDDSLWGRAPVHPARTRQQLLDLEADQRFETRYYVVRRGARVDVLLPVYSPLTDAAPDPAYDVARVTSASPTEARSWTLLGGRSLVSSAPLVTAEADPGDVDSAVGRAVAEARGRGRRCAALYVGGDDARFRAALEAAGLRNVTHIATRWDLPAREHLDAFVAALPNGKRRATVRRDLADAAAGGLTARAEPYSSLSEQAAELVAATALRHGSPDDPDLVELRLDRWGSDPALTPVAWAVRDDVGDLLGASFAWCVPGSPDTPGTVDVHAIGVRDGIRDRGLVYRELTIMAPLRRAWADGLPQISLGLDSSPSKRLRGAIGTPVLAMADDA